MVNNKLYYIIFKNRINKNMSLSKFEFKTPMVHALVYGCIGLSLYCATTMLMSGSEEDGSYGKPASKEDTIKMVLEALKQELRKDFEIELPRGADGLLEKETFVRIHSLMYKYRKYGQDMLIAGSSNERIYLLR